MRDRDKCVPMHTEMTTLYYALPMQTGKSVRVLIAESDKVVISNQTSKYVFHFFVSW